MNYLVPNYDLRTHGRKNNLETALVILLAFFVLSTFFSGIFLIPFLGSPATAIIRVSTIIFILKKLFYKEKFVVSFFPLFLLWGFNFISILWSTVQLDTYSRITSLFQFCIIIFISADVIRKKEDVDLIALFYIVGSFFSMAFLFFMILTGFRPEEFYDYETRLTLLGQDPNGLAYFFCIGFVFVRDFFINEAKKGFVKKLWIKTLLSCSFLLTPVAIIATGSRTGFVIYLFVLITFFTSKRSMLGAFLA